MNSFEAAFVRCPDPLRVEVTEVRGREPWQVFTEPARRGCPFSILDADWVLTELGYERTTDWRMSEDGWGAPVRQRVLSGCCGAPVITAGHTTRWYKCFRCGMPCDVKTA